MASKLIKKIKWFLNILLSLKKITKIIKTSKEIKYVTKGYKSDPIMANK